MSTNVSDTATAVDVGGAIQADAVIVGAGPCGLFQIFELGLLGIRAHIIDSLQHPGGQCSELYPEKPIYDIPALARLWRAGAGRSAAATGQAVQRAVSYGAGSHGVEGRCRTIHSCCGRRWTPAFTRKTVIIAGGLGSFQPRRLGCEGVDAFEDTTVHYKVKKLR